MNDRTGEIKSGAEVARLPKEERKDWMPVPSWAVGLTDVERRTIAEYAAKTCTSRKERRACIRKMLNDLRREKKKDREASHG